MGEETTDVEIKSNYEAHSNVRRPSKPRSVERLRIEGKLNINRI